VKVNRFHLHPVEVKGQGFLLFFLQTGDEGAKIGGKILGLKVIFQVENEILDALVLGGYG